MCTFSLIAAQSARGASRLPYRLAFNRDELRTRPEGRSPQRTLVGGRQALYPVDPLGGGTWLGCNDAGLALALLNVNVGVTAPAYQTEAQRRARPSYSASRGALIPALLGESSTAAVGRRLATLETRACAPFRLVAVDGRDLAWWRWDGTTMTHDRVTLMPDAAICFVSSGLGDDRVEGPRQALFATLLNDAATATVGDAVDGVAGAIAAPRAAAQAAFHAHQWPDRPELSVHMSRPDAFTVSRAAIEATATTMRLTYEPVTPDGVPQPAVETSLAMRPDDTEARRDAAAATGHAFAPAAAATEGRP